MICDPGWAACGGNGCDTSTTSTPAHTHFTSSLDSPDTGGCSGGPDTSAGSIGSCTLGCDAGFFDCDNDHSNGCETQAVLGCADANAKLDAGEPTTPHRIATLAGEPRGLVACGGAELFFDDSDLWAIDSATLHTSFIATSPAVPSGGLACDGTFVYWATLSDGDASPNGAIYRVQVGGGTPQALETGIDPQSGIEIGDGGLFLMTRTGLALSSGTDAGLIPWLAASETGAYKPFALSPIGQWAIDPPAINRRVDDAAAPWIDDAGAPSALLTTSSGEPLVVLHTLVDDAGLDAAARDFLAHLIDDAGMASLTVLDASMNPIVATSSGAKTIVASDDTIYLVAPPTITTLYTEAGHIAHVIVDGKWVVWATRSSGIWRGVLP